MSAEESNLPLAYLQTVLEASHSLIQSQTVEEVLARTVRLCEQMLEADAFAVWQMDRPVGRVRLLLASGLSESYLTQSEVPLPEEDFRLSEMIILDVENEPLLEPIRGRYRDEGIRSLLVLPLLIEGEDFGTLTLYYRSPHSFEEFELVLARTMANLASAGIASARHQEEQSRAKQLLEEALANERKVESRLNFINRAGVILHESLDYNVTLSNLTRAMVPEYADWCTVHLLKDGLVQRVALAHVDPDRVRWAEELQEHYPSNPNARQGVHQVIRTGKSELMREIPRELVLAAAQDEEHLRLIEQAGLKSYICVPLRTRSGVIGALTLIQAESGRAYEMEDLRVAEEVGWRAGLAVEKVMLFQESQRAREELERSNHAKDEFLGIVSHELRTPVTSIYGSASLLRRAGTSLDDKTRDELVRVVEEEAARMASLIESLLMLARLDLGQAVNLTPLDLKSALARCVESFTSSGRIIEIDYRTDSFVDADPTYLDHVLNNLVSNADKYSPTKAPISVVVEEQAEEVLIRVQDEGPGVDPSELELIFDSFYRSPKTADRPGKGLGLGICKRLVEAQSGSIRAILRPAGGLEVAFSLPKAGASTAITADEKWDTGQP